MSNIYTLPHNCQVKDLDKIYEKYFPEDYKGVFVDVGAYNGYDFSNTYPLLLNKWSGIGFEPNPVEFEKCNQLYQKYNSRVFPYAIGSKNELVKLYLAGTLSTTSETTLEKYSNIYWSKPLINKDNTFDVAQFTLDSALISLARLSTSTRIDVMSIDTEGTEADVLEGLFLYDVFMFIIETHEFADEQELNTVQEVETYLKRYNKIYSDEINSIYVLKN